MRDVVFQHQQGFIDGVPNKDFQYWCYRAYSASLNCYVLMRYETLRCLQLPKHMYIQYNHDDCIHCHLLKAASTG